MDEGPGRLHESDARENSAARHPPRRITTFGDAAPARVSSVQISGEYFYYLKRKADENIAKLYVRRAAGGNERLLVDPEKLPAPEGKHNAIDYFAPSPDNRYLAYGVSVGGSEESVLRVVEVASGKETGDVIDRANFAQSVVARRAIH